MLYHVTKEEHIMNIIARLWNGSVVPVRNFGEGNPEMKELERLIRSNMENLGGSLNEKERAGLTKLVDCINEYMYVANEQAFCDGFCLGTRITAEAVSGAERILPL